MANYVLDTSAILALFKSEPGHEAVTDILRRAEDEPTDHVYVPFLALMEVEYQFIRDMTEDRVQYWLNVALNWPIEVVESTPEWRHRAAAVKAPGHVSLADSWVAALALIHDADLVHKDPEFENVPNLKHLKLPYDRDTRRTNR